MRSISLVVAVLIIAVTADHVHYSIPEIVSAVDYLLSEFAHYPAYHGPTGTATAATKSTATVLPTASAVPTNATPYWLEEIKHQGISALNPDKSYQVFRNVKDYGAKGCVYRTLLRRVR